MNEKEDLEDVIKLISDIKHGKLYNSFEIALITEKLLETLISTGKWKNAQDLMEQIKSKIRKISRELPLQGIAANIMRHILKVIREEYDIGSEKKTEEQSLHQLVSANVNNPLDYSASLENLKSHLLDHLSEYKVELESSTENIATQALEHIHSNEIILTFGKSNTVEKFLKYAAKERTFQVIVVEAAPAYHGQRMAVALARSGIQTTVIPDAAVFALMSRTNKVIIGTHTVMADGGLRTASGLHAVALAAKHHSVPVLVLAHLYKLTPEYVCSHERNNVFASPAAVLPYHMGAVLNGVVAVHNPVFDHVPPELVTLLISHQGGNAPSYVYRLLSELYHPDDYEI